ncbi:unnamed protein product [Protopolystoma xenopodis]|uniref:Uncharacterized protein n=1 Tax=Protopolystoma xenopodis TaxID=117903 RepID=A0A3S5BF97_9PLAT|nr:unnamed protein product [Protopolystoma xenopodis]
MPPMQLLRQLDGRWCPAEDRPASGHSSSASPAATASASVSAGQHGLLASAVPEADIVSRAPGGLTTTADGDGDGNGNGDGDTASDAATSTLPPRRPEAAKGAGSSPAQSGGNLLADGHWPGLRQRITAARLARLSLDAWQASLAGNPVGTRTARPLGAPRPGRPDWRRSHAPLGRGVRGAPASDVGEATCGAPLAGSYAASIAHFSVNLQQVLYGLRPLLDYPIDEACLVRRSGTRLPRPVS